MSSDSGTVVALKSAFLRSQIRILSQPLQPTDRWRESSDIPASALRDVLNEVNRILRRHNDAVYYSLAIRAVAQQIDQLYWDSSSPESAERDRGLDDDSELRQTDDLTRDDKIAVLPDAWSDSLEYAALLEKLQVLSSRRAELRKKLKLYRQLQSMAAPFRSPQTAIQPNLVSRDGPLTKEMEKTKSLGIRVAGGLVERNRGPGSGDPTHTR